MYRSRALLDAIAGLPCKLRLTGCLGSPCVAAHSNWAIHGKGRGIKAHDCFAVPACYACHYELDQGKKMTGEERREAWERAWRETILALFRHGLVSIGRASPILQGHIEIPKILPRRA